MSKLLEVKDLRVSIPTDAGKVEAVCGVSFSLNKGETLAVVGESGSGKSILCKSIMKLLPHNALLEGGSIKADGMDITACKDREMQKLRGSLFSMIFQDPMTSLDPTMKIGTQIAEAVLVHNKTLSKEQVYQRVIELMRLVGISEPEKRYHLYPYNFSGGMRQRSVMAIALAGSPKILIADEPTTALDVTIQAQILDLLQRIQKEMGMASILVSHDLGVVARTADRVAIMYAGKIVEIGTAEEIYYDPRHPYTWGLLGALPALAKEGERLKTIPGMPPTLIGLPKGDAFASRNPYALGMDYEQEPPMFRITDTHYAASWLLDPRAEQAAHTVDRSRRQVAADSTQIRAHEKDRNGVNQHLQKYTNDILVDVRHVTCEFPLSRKQTIRAVDDVSIQISKGEILGIVGESGSGKSTLARCIMNVYQPQQGQIFYDGVDTCDRSAFKANRRKLQAERQIIFQDSTSSLNQRMKVADLITEPMQIHHVTTSRGSLREEAAFQLKYVGLNDSYLDKYPSELSGGQRQRVAIARALTMEPQLLVADEPIASLDVSIQAQIINLFQHLREEHGFSILFIAHDLAMVKYLCDRIGVMYQGKLVEIGDKKQLFETPGHAYTRALLSAIPYPDPRKERKRTHVDFEHMTFRKDGDMIEIEPGHYVLGGADSE